MIMSVTGHRPKQLFSSSKYPYSQENKGFLVEFATAIMKQAIDKFPDLEVVRVGGAIGWDQAVTDACIKLNIPFDVYVPMRGQEKLWPHDAQVAYQLQLLEARKIVIVTDTEIYNPTLMELRNRAMINGSDVVLALYNGAPYGGTANAVHYAKEQNIPVYNVYRIWAGLD